MAENAFADVVRAMASKWYTENVDGIYVFNMWPPHDYSCLKELHDPRDLAGKSKLYRVDNGIVNVFPYYAHISSRPPLPMLSRRGVIRRGIIQRVPIDIGDDIQKVLADETTVRASLKITFDDPLWRDRLQFRMNRSRSLISGSRSYMRSAGQQPVVLTTAISVQHVDCGYNSSSFMKVPRIQGTPKL